MSRPGRLVLVPGAGGEVACCGWAEAVAAPQVRKAARRRCFTMNSLPGKVDDKDQTTGRHRQLL
jgi:hypothetical protein